ncbi:hypothetical protein [Lactococcus lactis]|uniref:Uncharacterized protein n=1 Tax=Lactococcus lactis TaxID=1358 RepID=A0AAP4DUG3_9LACT|nr:hypothetical protein [Lactococcus lactis]MDG4976923.1 hypothetical protein [Lactococcus lactis]
MTIKKTIPILLTIWLWLSAPFFSQISFMNDSLHFVYDTLSKIIPIEWLVPVVLLLGIPAFSFIFYLYFYIKEKNNDLNLVYLLFATLCFLSLMVFGVITSIGLGYLL